MSPLPSALGSAALCLLSTLRASSLPGLGMSPPLEPERGPARELLEEELSDGRYDHADPGPIRELIREVLGWFDDRLVDLTGIDIPYGPVLLMLLLAAAITLVIVLVRPRLQHAAVEEQVLEQETGIGAEELRRRSARRLAGGDADAAFRDRFRALVRAAEERDVLPERPGRTATEAAVELGGPFAEQAGRLRMSAELFNLSRYGGRRLSAGDCEELAELDRILQHAQPAEDGDRLGAPARMVAPR